MIKRNAVAKRALAQSVANFLPINNNSERKKNNKNINKNVKKKMNFEKNSSSWLPQRHISFKSNTTL